ncbi:uncharacterized protein KLLA0_E24443g [Kluyveromyces lactis]|uniref:KLLA0E24443p n=1 Tax=Kluyveromyces lactis (strain ATCC 8585 / CBS 2359 / DSM 70799 / NBRC 1267 / NRRL Y-1140 / WM37) TaxID=284590 RepID=Q6CLY7_KLULA|nr:uncharacterized protein KLLA0_E24443g [Kluyveromyces lactis]CAH00139.1 KLLA0E24443p [Kluyveromyces lactis]|eukprot:XP_455052.1 uncharacterized protein KLLA0_E24443g [Kluyveromyces lactis]
MSNQTGEQWTPFILSTMVADTISSMIITDLDDDVLTVIDPFQDFLSDFFGDDRDIDERIEGETVIDDDSITDFDSTSVWSSSRSSNDSEYTHTSNTRPYTRGEIQTYGDSYGSTNIFSSIPNFISLSHTGTLSNIYWYPTQSVSSIQDGIYDSDEGVDVNSSDHDGDILERPSTPYEYVYDVRDPSNRAAHFSSILDMNIFNAHNDTKDG